MQHGSTRLFKRSAALAAGALALVVAACGGAAPQTQADAYAVATKTFDASWDQVKVQIGLTATGTGSDITLKPDAIQFAIDSKAGKGSLHLSIPKSALGDQAATLAPLGLTGDTLDVDALYDGQALYAKSPIAAALLPMLMAQSGQTLTGDLSGWLRLGTAADFAPLAGSLGGSLGALPSPDASAASELSALDAAALKAKLDEAGVVLTYVGIEQRNGVETDHLTATIDAAKFAASDLARQLPADRLSTVTGAASSATLSADLWLDKSSGRPAEVAIHVAEKSGGKAELTILVGTPDAAAFATPDGATEVPLAPILSQMLPMLSGLGG